MSIGLQSRLWVAAQFGLIAVMLLWPADWGWSGAGFALGALAVALVLWVFAHNRPGNFNIRPEPKEGARLVTGGPYRWVRHPMYVALLLGMAGVAAMSHGLAQAILWLALQTWIVGWPGPLVGAACLLLTAAAWLTTRRG